MRSILILVGVTLTIADYTIAQDSAGRNLYSSRYDNIEVESILSSHRLVTNYVDCLTNKKPCPPEGKELKRILPEALRTKCARCSPKQKENALKIIRRLYERYPEHYNALREKWDQTGEYHRRFEQYLRDEQFNSVHSADNRPYPIDPNRGQTPVNVQSNGFPQSNRPQAAETPAQPPLLLTRVPVSPVQQPAIAAVTPTTPRADRSRSVPSSNRNTVQLLATTEPTIINLANRFGGDDDEEASMPVANIQPIMRQQPPMRPIENNKTPTLVQTPKPTPRTPNYKTAASNGAPPSIIDNFFQPPSNTYRPPTQAVGHPFHGFINAIGNKISNIAGMIHSTVRVIVGGGPVQ